MNPASGTLVSFADASALSGGDRADLVRANAAYIGDLVERIAAVDAMLAAVTAHRAELIDYAHTMSEEAAATRGGSGRTGGWDAQTVASREFASELACALRIPERTAENLIAESRSLTSELPETLEALRSGAISHRHARSIVEHANSLPVEARRDFETAVLPAAKTLTVARFDRTARVAREKAHPESIETRKAACVDDRSLSVEPVRDGMAYLSAYVSAEQAVAIHNRVTEIAMALRGPDEPRTLSQLRADVFADLLIDGEIAADIAASDGRAGLGRGIRARVLVTVPVLTLLDRGNAGSGEPAMLEGYGPIDAETARRLAAHAPSFTRILTHPETGAILSVGRDRYRVPEDLRAWLRVRDETCRHPGCGRTASQCEIDHTTDWQFEGETNYDNLAHLCESHHQLKHHTGWTVEQVGNGALEWTSPGGRTYTTRPAHNLPAA